MVKAIFELAKDRADYISLLFAKPRPAGLDVKTPIQEIWQAYATVATDSALPEDPCANRRAPDPHTSLYVQRRGVGAALIGVRSVRRVWASISTRGGGGGGNNYSFADVPGGRSTRQVSPESFLSTDEHYQSVRSLHVRNLIVPISGDFGGPKALRAIGAYLRKRSDGERVYVSNVEQSLFQDGKQRAFYDNVAALPLDAKSVFIRPYSLRRSPSPRPLCPVTSFLAAVDAGLVFSNNEAIVCARL